MMSPRTQSYGWSRHLHRHVGQYVTTIGATLGTSLLVLLRVGLSLWELFLFWTIALGGLALIGILAAGFMLVLRRWQGH